MGKVLDFFNNAKRNLVNFLIKNKVFISAVVKYVSIAYETFGGEQKMEQAIKFLLILVNLSGVANEYSDDIAKLIEQQVQKVYDEMKEKGLLE